MDADRDQDPGRRPRRHAAARAATGSNASYDTDTLTFGAGESFDAIFTAPAYQGNGTDPDTYVLFNRTYTRSDNLAGAAAVAVSAPRSMSTRPDVPQQRFPNDHECPVMPDMSGVTPMSATTHRTSLWLVLITSALLACAALTWTAARNGTLAATESSNRVGMVCTTGAPLTPTFTLTTKAGYIGLPDGTTAYMCGYSEGSKPFQHPGPVLCVNEGDTVTVILHNTLDRACLHRLPRPA